MQLILRTWPPEAGGPTLRLASGQYLVGRSDECQVRLLQHAVSRRHCLLVVGPDRATVRDLESRNRTLLNSRPVGDEQQFRAGDRLTVCRTTFQVRLLDDATRPDPAWVTVPLDPPGVSIDPPPESPRCRDATLAGEGPAFGRVPGMAEPVAGLYPVSLNIPGSDLTLHVDLRHRLGRGEFGQVWWARTRGTGSDWHDEAVKILHAPLDSERAELARLGATAVAPVPAHPGLLAPGLIGSFGGRLMVATRPADYSLADLAGVLPRADLGPRLLAAIRDAAAGLDHLHAHGLAHGCPKPADILLVRGRGAVADWDLAHPVGRVGGAEALARHGDPGYLAPEVWTGTTSGSSDQYALACGYAELRGGQRVFPVWERRDWALSHRTAVPNLSRLPTAERKAVARALAKDPAERYGSCREFVRALAGG
jgi:pSer/pThr/pTyr-binding forkhead associated (FHA) protein